MLYSYDELTVTGVAGIGFDDPQSAASLLRDLAGHDISDERFEMLLPNLATSLRATGDPDRALVNFAQWIERVGNRSTYFRVLTNHPAALNSLLTVFSVSQFFSDLLARYPEQFEVVINPIIRDSSRTTDSLLRAARLRMAVARSTGAKSDALRRFKSPEVLRIGARDILGIASVEDVTVEISDFAEACVRAAVELAGSTEGFAVIALGKLGGRELNYASDIDLVYVHDDAMPTKSALAIAEAVTRILSEPTEAGFLFRVDLRLRPEGRFGPIARSLSSCASYYESWAEPWERQAMLKARHIGGDPLVAAQFLAIIEPFVYRRTGDAAFIDSLRNNKRRIERKAQRDGEAHSNVKEGVGGIRDVEFIVQTIQLVAGGVLTDLRTGSTMEALRRIRAAGLLSEADADQLAESYLFLRNLEHRLQIMDERPVRSLPIDNSAALFKFARRLGYAASDEFLREYRRHTERTQAHLDRLFYGTVELERPQDANPEDVVLADWVRDTSDLDRRASVVQNLAAVGFCNPEAAAQEIEREVSTSRYGEPEPGSRELMSELAAPLVKACAQSGYPDNALKGLAILAGALPSPAAFFRTLLDSPELLERLALLAGAAPRVWETLVRAPELLDRLADDELLLTASSLRPPKPRLTVSARQAAAYIRRERLRLAALDLWGLTTPKALMGLVTDMAEVSLGAALDYALRELGFGDVNDSAAPIPALIGLGKLGGRELGYGGDWDVLWIAPSEPDDATAVSKQIAERAMAFLNAQVKTVGAKVEVDSRLRPDGRFGTLVRTLPDYLRYFETSADTWERQVLIKARCIGGDRRLGAQFSEAVARIVYDLPPNDVEIAQVRHLKSRMERERASSPNDIKLGPGGLSDIEWTVQPLQWQFGKRRLMAQSPNTLAALDVLRDDAIITQSDWEILSDGYLELYTARNRAWLLGVDDPPNSDSAKAKSLAGRRAQIREVFDRLFLKTFQ